MGKVSSPSALLRHLFRWRFTGQRSLLLLLGLAAFSLAAWGGPGATGPAVSDSIDLGLIGYWDMEGAGGQQVLTDRSGLGHAGTLGSSSAADASDPVFASGHDNSGAVGTALAFDGVDDYLGLGTGDGLDMGTSDRTFSAWFKSGGTLVGGRTILSSGAGSSGLNHDGVWISIVGDSSVIVHFSDGTADRLGKTFATSQPVLDDQWHNLIVVFDRDASASLYVDGIISPSGSLDITAQQGEVNDNYAYRMGRYASGSSGTYPFPGSIDEARIYDRVLSPGEIQLLYNRKQPVLSYDFDEGAGSVVHDGSFNRYDATLGGGAADCMPAWVPGKRGGALSFDGVDDYLSRNLPLSGQAGTVSLWAKDPDPGQGEYLLSSDTNTRTYFDLAYDSFIFTKGDPAAEVGERLPLAQLSGWHHYELTWHQLDGVLYASSYFDGRAWGSEVSFTDASPGSFITLGGWSASHEENGGGTVDELRVYQYARTPEEVLVDYNGTLAARLGQGGEELASGLAAYWDFEPGSGQSVADRSGLGNAGRLGSTDGEDDADPFFVSGHDAAGEGGSGMGFQGDAHGGGDYLEAGSGPSLNLPGDLSLDLWVKFDNYDPYQEVLDNGQYSLFVRGDWAGPAIYFCINTNEQSPPPGSDSAWDYQACIKAEQQYTAGVWYHIAGVKSGDTLRIYVDGVLSKELPGVLAGYSAVTSPGDLEIGSGLSGTLDEVRIYGRALSPDEIQLLYNHKQPVLSYGFDEGAGVVAHDGSFNHLDAALGGGNSEAMPLWTAGHRGGALSFDGVDDLVATSSTALNGASAFTVSFWVRPDAFTGSEAFGADEVSNGHATSFGTQGIYYNGQRDTFAATIDTGGGHNVVGTVAQSGFLPGVWYHYEAVFDGSQLGDAGRLKLYLDGISQPLTFDGPVPEQSDDPGGAYPVRIGHRGTYAQGLLDDVRIYQYARTPEEVLVDYNGTLAAHLGKSSANIENGLAGHWDMEEGSGQTVHDKSGQGNGGILGPSDGIEAGDPVFSSGHDFSGARGTGLSFDGIDDHVAIGSNPSLSLGGSFSISAWIRTEADGRSIVEKGVSPSNYQLRLEDDRASLGIHDGTHHPEAVSSVPVADGQWHQVAGVRDTAADRLRIYVDGSLTGEAEDTTTAPISDSANAYIGAAGDLSSARFFSGSIDSVYLYDRALSQDEIQLLYNRKAPLLAYEFDEGSGEIAHDASFNRRDAAISGATWASGQRGSALSFDGADDYLSRALSLSGQAGTVSLWIKDPAPGQGEYIFRSDANGRTYFDLAYDSFIFAKGDPYTAVGTPIPIAQLSGWHHYELTWHSVADSLFASSYFDGRARGREVSFADASPGSFITLGGFLPSGTENAAGTLDELRVYGYARTPEEVRVDYNDGLAAHLR